MANTAITTGESIPKFIQIDSVELKAWTRATVDLLEMAVSKGKQAKAADGC